MAEPSSTSTRSWIMRLLVTCIALGFVAALGQLIPQAMAIWQQINWSYLGVAVALTMSYRVFNALGWGLALRAFRQKLAIRLVLRTWLRSEACRWLPGSVWCLGSRAFIAGELGLASPIAAASVALEFVLTIAAWVTACALGLVVNGAMPLAIVTYLPLQAIVLTTFIVFGGFVATYLWLCYSVAGKNKLAKLQQKILSIQSLRPKLSWSLGTFVYYVALCVLNGFALQYIIQAFAPDIQLPLLTIVGLNSLAWLVGFSAVIAPSGVIVREGCLAGLLMAWLPESTALAVAVTWRLVQIGVELTCLLATYAPSFWKHIFSSQVVLPTSR